MWPHVYTHAHPCPVKTSCIIFYTGICPVHFKCCVISLFVFCWLYTFYTDFGLTSNIVLFGSFNPQRTRCLDNSKGRRGGGILPTLFICPINALKWNLLSQNLVIRGYQVPKIIPVTTRISCRQSVSPVGVPARELPRDTRKPLGSLFVRDRNPVPRGVIARVCFCLLATPVLSLPPYHSSPCFFLLDYEVGWTQESISCSEHAESWDWEGSPRVYGWTNLFLF